MPHATQRQPRAHSNDPVADRIAALSAEYIDANADRRAEIASEFDALMDESVLPIPTKGTTT